jgi:hypothetical protein
LAWAVSVFLILFTHFAYKPKVTIILILIIVCRGFVCGGRTIADYFLNMKLGRELASLSDGMDERGCMLAHDGGLVR